MKLLKQVSAVVCAVSVFACSGCSGSVAVTANYSYDTGTGASTIGGSVNGTWKFGSQDKANFMAEGDPSSPSSYTFVESIPSVFTSSSSTSPQVTLTATTDTGYTSSITVALQPTSTTVAPVNQGDVVYAFTIPASAALTTWEQNLNANATSQATVSAVTNIPFSSNGTAGVYPFTTIVQTPTAYATATGSATIIHSGNPGKCPGSPSCPVPVDPGE